MTFVVLRFKHDLFRIFSPPVSIAATMVTQGLGLYDEILRMA